MSFPIDTYPYTNFHELNLGYFITHFREIFSQWADLYDQMTDWKDATDEELATWKAGVEADLDQREAELRAELETWKAQTGQDIAGWEDATLAALTAWQTATQALFEAIRVEAAGSASAAAASAGDAATAKTAAETAQAAAEAAAASVQASAAQIATNTDDISDLKTQLNNAIKNLAENATAISSLFIGTNAKLQSFSGADRLICVEALPNKKYRIKKSTSTIMRAGCGATSQATEGDTLKSYTGFSSASTDALYVTTDSTNYYIYVQLFDGSAPASLQSIAANLKTLTICEDVSTELADLSTLTEKYHVQIKGVQSAITESVADYTSEMIPNYYIKTNGEIGEAVDLTPVRGGFRYIILKVSRGEVYTVTAHGGGAPEPWCLTDNNNIKLASGNYVYATDVEITVEEDGYLIVNSATGSTTKIEKNIYYDFDEINYIDNFLGINDIDNLTFEQGAINNATGANNNDSSIVNIRVRTLPFYAAKGSSFKRINNSALSVFLYNDENAIDYLGTNGLGYNDYVLQTNCYVRLVLAKNNTSSNISVNEIKNYLECKINGITTEANENHDRNEGIYLPAVPPKTNLVINTVPFDDNTENTLSEIYAGYDSLVSLYPDYVSKTDLGVDSSGDYHIYRYDFTPKSVELLGSPVTRNRFNTKRYPVIFLDSGIHSNEKPCMRALLNVMTLICQAKAEDNELGWLRHNAKIIVVPMVNPWGYVNNTRYNYNHVNLNRNFNTPEWVNGSSDATSVDYRGASPASEIETQYVQAILDEISDNICSTLYYSYHTHGELTSFHQMTAFDVANLEQDKLQKIGIELAIDITKSGWKNHELTTTANDPYIGEVEFMTLYAMSDMYGALKGIPSACPECMYRYYDGQGGADWSHKLNCMNAEYVLKTITIGINRLLYSD